MKKEEIKQFYENYHTKGIINPVADFMQKERCDYLRFLLKNISGEILIIGCGSQDDMSIISERCEGVGIDISAEAVKKSKEKYPRFEYFVADATNLPFPDNSFDCVVCSEVIEHIPEDEKVLSEAKRVLKNKGTFIVTTPNWLSWYGLARKTAEKLFKRPFTAGDQPIDNWSTPSHLKQKLTKYGFEITLFRGLWYYPPTGKGRKQIPHKIIFPIVKLFYSFEILFRRIFPWFGHMILFKTKLVKL
ncbi:MAG: methyltransferase domain-containing protein [Candidatus Pacebacteria bacterium]|nr:methyltransferase domain-containing protein [Candidatus Paceibacterota bacterium]